MRKMVRRIDVLSAGKIVGTIHVCIGLIAGIVVALVSMLGLFASAIAHGRAGAGALGLIFGVGAIIIFPVVEGFVGAIMAMIVSLIYNAAAGIVGGLELEVEDR